MPQNYYFGVIDLGKISNLQLWLQITVGNPLCPSWGQCGPIGAEKWVKTVKNYHAPKFEFLTTFGHRFGQKIEFTVMAPNHGGDPLGSIFGPMGSHWGKKWVKTVKNYHAAKFEFLIISRSSIWAKNRIYGYGAKSRWGPPRVHLEANGVPLGPKNGSKPSKITMPQNSNFWLLHGHRFGKKKIEFTVLGPNHGGGPLGYILGRWGPIGVKKWFKTVKNYHGAEFYFLTTPQSSIWAKNRIYGYGAKSRWGPPRGHLRANGFLLGQKNGSKP